jgi:hypothetical protein
MFRFTIRDVLWLTVVVALVVGWWVHASRMQSDLVALDEENIFLRGQILALDNLPDGLRAKLNRP